MCSVFRSHNPIPLSYFTTYHSILTSDTTGATGGTISQPKINKIIKCFGSTQQLVLVVRFRFKIDHCFTMTSYDGLVYYLIFHNGVFYNNIIHITTSVFYNNIIHITTSECILYNNAVRPVICEGWHFTHTWKSFAWPHHFTKGRGFGP